MLCLAFLQLTFPFCHESSLFFVAAVLSSVGPVFQCVTGLGLDYESAVCRHRGRFPLVAVVKSPTRPRISGRPRAGCSTIPGRGGMCGVFRLTESC